MLFMFMTIKIIQNSKFFCLKLKILLTAELIEFTILGKLHTGPEMDLGYFNFIFRCWDNFRLFWLIVSFRFKS